MKLVARPNGRPRSNKTPSVPIPPDAVLAARRVLRYFHQPQRLRRDGLVTRYMPAYIDASDSDQFWMESIDAIVRSAIAGEPSRTRIIIERTALDGEPVSAVAKSLGLSERQLYRDRALATDAIARQLIVARQEHQRATVTVARPLDLHLSYAHMLEQLGQLDAAETTLSRLAGQIDSLRDRVIVNSHVARLLLAQGRRKDAESAARLALSEAILTDGDTLARSVVECVLGEIALNSGEMVSAQALLRRSAVGLRSLLAGTDREHACASLARALITQSCVEASIGQYEKACQSAREAQHELRDLARPNQSLQLAARVALATASAFVWSDPSAIEEEMRACYDAALARNSIMSAVEVSFFLSWIYRFRGEAARAFELFSSLLPIVRGLSTSRSKAAFFLTFANMLSECAQQDGAAMRMLLEGAQSTLPDQPDLEAHILLTTARVRLAGGADMEAMNAADEAAFLFSRLGYTELFGVSLHLEGKAWAKMQRVGDAVRTVRRSVEALSLASHPVELERARNTLYHLTGNGRNTRRGA